MKIYITGGGGYVGTACAALFQEKGHQVSCFDRKPFDEWLNPSTNDRVCDVSTNLFGSYLHEGKPDVVLHLAAQTSPTTVATGYTANVVCAAEVMEHAHAAGVPRMVFASSAAVYPELSQPVTEDTGTAPITRYGRTKAVAENVLTKMAHELGISFMPLRYFNVCGGAFVPPQGTTIVPAAVRAALTGRPLSVFGRHHVRDFIHIHNVAEATLAACDSRWQGPVNVGTGKATTVEEVIRTVERLTDSPVQFSDNAPGVQLSYSVADVTRFQRTLAKGMELLSLENAIENTILSMKRGVVRE